MQAALHIHLLHLQPVLPTSAARGICIHFAKPLGSSLKNHSERRQQVNNMISDDDRPASIHPLDTAVHAGVNILRGPPLVLLPAERMRLDDSRAVLQQRADADAVRMVQRLRHTDGAFRAQLTDLYRGVLQPGARVLDLCSSWDSHLPEEVQLQEVVGHGVSAAELLANTRLDRHFVQDLNVDRRLPLADASVDVVLCSNGLQYLTHPEWVFAEVARVLAPSGACIVSFSTHCWPDKATAAWLQRTLGQRLKLISKLASNAGLCNLRIVHQEPGMSGASAASGICTTPSHEGARDCRESAVGVQEPAQTGHLQGNGLLPPPSQQLSNQLGLSGEITLLDGGSSASQPERALLAFDPLYAVVAYKAGEAQGQSSAAGVQQSGNARFAGVSATLPAEVAATYLGPALREMDARQELTSLQQQQEQQLPNTVQHDEQGSEPLQANTIAGSPQAAQASAAPVACGKDGMSVDPVTMERWRYAYEAMADEAVEMGIPRDVIPKVSLQTSPQDLKAARDHLQDMIASFLSACL